MPDKKLPDWRDLHTIVFDFDGVFTDNKVWVDQNGVESVRCDRGDGLGFDIHSFEPDGRDRLIEVKTTAFAKESAFFITPNELECSRSHSDHYHLFRLFNFRKGPKFFCLKGDLQEQLWLEPDSYRAGVR